MKKTILVGTVLNGESHGTEFRGRLIKYLSNGCALIGDEEESHIVYDYCEVKKNVSKKV